MLGSDRWWQMIKKAWSEWWNPQLPVPPHHSLLPNSAPGEASQPPGPEPLPTFGSTFLNNAWGNALNMFASLLICCTVHDFSPPPAPCSTRRDTGADQQEGSLKKSCQCTAEFLVFASKHRASLVCRRGLIFVGSPWQRCCLSKPVAPSRVRGDTVKVKGTLRVKSEGIRDALWCLTKMHMSQLGGLLSETVPVSITVIFKRPSVEHLKASCGLGTLSQHIPTVAHNKDLLRVSWFYAEITDGMRKMWKQA